MGAKSANAKHAVRFALFALRLGGSPVAHVTAGDTWRSRYPVSIFGGELDSAKWVAGSAFAIERAGDESGLGQVVFARLHTCRVAEFGVRVLGKNCCGAVLCTWPIAKRCLGVTVSCFIIKITFRPNKSGSTRYFSNKVQVTKDLDPAALNRRAICDVIKDFRFSRNLASDRYADENTAR